MGWGSKWNLQPLEEGKTCRENADTHREGENTVGSRVVKSGTSMTWAPKYNTLKGQNKT